MSAMSLPTRKPGGYLDRLIAVMPPVLATAVLLSLLGAMQSPATADTTYQPGGGWNGHKIYLSVACHDGTDGVPGGPCITNPGCQNYSENAESSTMATTTAIGIGTGDNLIERGYRARVGDGTLNQNVSNSNAWGADMHVPLHTDARDADTCANTDNSKHGTSGLYLQNNDRTCATTLRDQVGQASPGTNDKIVPRDDLGELRANAVACYLEADFHTWNRGVNWIENEVNWTWRVGQTVDLYFGWPV